MMTNGMGMIEPRHLHKRWIHSHEEDTGDEMVFRAEGFDFPRSRGRAAFELKPDQTLVETGIAPADGPETSVGRWELRLDDRLILYREFAAAPSRVLQIIAVDGDRLVVRRAETV